MGALVWNGFDQNRDEELQATGGELQKMYLTGVGMRDS